MSHLDFNLEYVDTQVSTPPSSELSADWVALPQEVWEVNPQFSTSGFSLYLPPLVNVRTEVRPFFITDESYSTVSSIQPIGLDTLFPLPERKKIQPQLEVYSEPVPSVPAWEEVESSILPETEWVEIEEEIMPASDWIATESAVETPSPQENLTTENLILADVFAMPADSLTPALADAPIEIPVPPLTPSGIIVRKKRFKIHIQVSDAEAEKFLTGIPTPTQNLTTPASADLMNKFLQKEPKISSPKDYSTNDLMQVQREDDEVLTETMARLHLLQGNKNEAIEIYRQLSLLFPEKSAYFAGQIENIQIS